MRESFVPITDNRGESEYDVTAALEQKHIYTQLTKERGGLSLDIYTKCRHMPKVGAFHLMTMCVNERD